MANYTSATKLERMSIGNAEDTLGADARLCREIIAGLEEGSVRPVDGRSVRQHLAAERAAMRGILERAKRLNVYVGEAI